MIGKFVFLALLGIAISGCANLSAPDAPDSSATAQPIAPAPSSTEMLEQYHHGQAQQFVREHNWADALVQWELLVLLRPDAKEYRDAADDARKRIRDNTLPLLGLAEQARRQGNLDQATLLYLRVLNTDRDNTIAAQALRDIENERNRRLYYHRPPRMVM